MTPDEKPIDTPDDVDALLTAYALGELRDADRAAVERRLENDTEAQRVVREVRATAALLEDGLGTKPSEAPALTAEQREGIAAAARESSAADAPVLRPIWPIVGLAASVVAAAGLAAYVEYANPAPAGAGSEREVAGVPRDAAAVFERGLPGAGEARTERRHDPMLELEAGARLKTLQDSNQALGAGSEALRSQLEAERSQRGAERSQPDGAYGGPPRALAPPLLSAAPELLPPVADSPPAPPAKSPAAVAGVTVAGGTTSTPKPDGTIRFGGGGGGGGARLPGAGARGPEVRREPPGARRVRGSGSSSGGGGEGGGGEGGGGEGGADVTFDDVFFGASGKSGVRGGDGALAADGSELDGVGYIAGGGKPKTKNEFLRVTREDGAIVLVPEQLGRHLEHLVYSEILLSSALRGRRERPSTQRAPGGESYVHPGEATFRDPAHDPLSTFSIDVDTASYANVRRFLNNGQLPPAAAVRLEEMVNYFSYEMLDAPADWPCSTVVEVAACPWETRNRLVRIGLKARDPGGDTGPANLVFLIDVSGSMQPGNKLPLLKRGMKLLAQQMKPADRVGIVTYASQAGVLLSSSSEQATVIQCIDGLSAGGSTNGGAGIQQAYAMARRHFVKGGVNRVILATDGDFNVGITDRSELIRLIQTAAKSGVYLSVLGFGTGNLKDATLEQLADKGNGNYAYVDSLREARKVLVEQMRSTLVTVAKDVKLQVEFNPLRVHSYRLLGYENRALAAADFNDDRKDAGEMGAGHTVTALYEIVPVGRGPAPGVDPLRYQRPQTEPTDVDVRRSGELLTVKLRYKDPDATQSRKIEFPVTDSGKGYAQASGDFKFAASVAAFGLLLRNSPTRGTATYDAVLELAGEALGEDPRGYRAEFLDLVLKAKTLSGR